MDKLEQLKMQKLAEMQQEQTQQEAEFVQQLEQLEVFVKQKMTKEAVQRYGNIKAAHPEKTAQLLAVLAQMIQQGKIELIDDNSMKEILTKLAPEKKEFKIKKV